MSTETMVPCDHVIAQLWEYLDGTLDDLRSEHVRRHLDACKRCFPEYDFRRAYLKFMRRCSSGRVRPELRRQIFEMILEEERQAKRIPADTRGTLFDAARAAFRRIFRKE